MYLLIFAIPNTNSIFAYYWSVGWENQGKLLEKSYLESQIKLQGFGLKHNFWLLKQSFFSVAQSGFDYNFLIYFDCPHYVCMDKEKWKKFQEVKLLLQSILYKDVNS